MSTPLSYSNHPVRHPSCIIQAESIFLGTNYPAPPNHRNALSLPAASATCTKGSIISFENCSSSNPYEPPKPTLTANREHVHHKRKIGSIFLARRKHALCTTWRFQGAFDESCGHRHVESCLTVRVTAAHAPIE